MLKSNLYPTTIDTLDRTTTIPDWDHSDNLFNGISSSTLAYHLALLSGITFFTEDMKGHHQLPIVLRM